MNLNNDYFFHAAREQLAIDHNCAPEDFLRPGFHFREMLDHPKRRPFARSEDQMDMVTMGAGIIVSAPAHVLEEVRPKLEGKFRDDAFAQPFIYGHSMYYLPDMARLNDEHFRDASQFAAGITLGVIEKSDIPPLYALPSASFGNAMQYDIHHARPDALLTVAYHEDEIIAMAGVSEDCDLLWQIGIDVLPEYRHLGLATILVRRLAQETLQRGKIPYYGTASSNIASQRVAHRAGFQPAWMCSYRSWYNGALVPVSH